jgi:hypothetical protein
MLWAVQHATMDGRQYKYSMMCVWVHTHMCASMMRIMQASWQHRFTLQVCPLWMAMVC